MTKPRLQSRVAEIGHPIAAGQCPQTASDRGDYLATRTCVYALNKRPLVLMIARPVVDLKSKVDLSDGEPIRPSFEQAYSEVKQVVSSAGKLSQELK